MGVALLPGVERNQPEVDAADGWETAVSFAVTSREDAGRSIEGDRASASKMDFNVCSGTTKQTATYRTGSRLFVDPILLHLLH